MEKITDIKENLQVKEIFKKGRTIIFVIDDILVYLARFC